MPKITIYHVDTCLPDYWGGHHKCHVSVPVYKNMKAEDLRIAIRSEISQGAFAGSDNRFHEWHESYDENLYAACIKACEEMEFRKEILFTELDEQDEDADFSVYAYFILEVEDVDSTNPD